MTKGGKEWDLNKSLQLVVVTDAREKASNEPNTWGRNSDNNEDYVRKTKNGYICTAYNDEGDMCMQTSFVRAKILAHIKFAHCDA